MAVTTTPTAPGRRTADGQLRHALERARRAYRNDLAQGAIDVAVEAMGLPFHMSTSRTPTDVREAVCRAITALEARARREALLGGGWSGDGLSGPCRSLAVRLNGMSCLRRGRVRGATAWSMSAADREGGRDYTMSREFRVFVVLDEGGAFVLDTVREGFRPPFAIQPPRSGASVQARALDETRVSERRGLGLMGEPRRVEVRECCGAVHAVELARAADAAGLPVAVGWAP